MKTRAVMVIILVDLIDFFNVGKSMSDSQVANVADMITSEYGFLKIDDFKLCFNRAKKGVYGQSYDRIDGQVIFCWLNKYIDERYNQADEESFREHSEMKMNEKRTQSILELTNKYGKR